MDSKENQKKEKSKGGRPQIKIDEKNFNRLCALQCTESEIAEFFDCSVDTVERWCVRTYGKRFAEIYARKRGVGKISLRRAQFRLAEKSAGMAIWLGKQYLGQRDVKEIQADVKTAAYQNPFDDLDVETLEQLAKNEQRENSEGG